MSNAKHTQSPASAVLASAPPRPGAGGTNDITQTHTTAPSTRRGHIGLIVVGSLATGLTAALLLTCLAVFAGAAEPVVTGSAMVGFGLGWAGSPVGVADRPAPAVGTGASRLFHHHRCCPNAVLARRRRPEPARLGLAPTAAGAAGLDSGARSPALAQLDPAVRGVPGASGIGPVGGRWRS